MYATLQDMMTAFELRELVDVTDDERTGQIASDRVDLALNRAAEEIDSYLLGTYTLPLPAVPPALKTYTCDIARYRLWNRKAEMPEAVKLAYDAAIRWLKAVSTGAVKLPMPGGEEAPSAPSTILIEAPCRVFSRHSMRGF